MTHERFRWHMADDFAPLLPELLHTKPAEVIKDDRSKFVARYDLQGRSYYIKRYRHSSNWLRPPKYILKRSQANKEWLAAQLCEERGIPTVRHLAFGERWSSWGLMESALITEGFDGVPIEPKHEQYFPELTEFVKRMGRKRIVHFDFHPANLLLNEERREIRLVDLYGVRVAHDTKAENACDFLMAQLAVTLAVELEPEMRQVAHEYRKSTLAKRARRCLKNNREFTRKKYGALRWQIRKPAITPAVERILNAPDAWLKQATMLKEGRSATVGTADHLVLKRNNYTKLLNPLKDLCRGSRARRNFLKGYHLELKGVPTARVIACAEHRVLGLPLRSYLVMEEVPHAYHAGDPKIDSECVVMLAALIAKLHDEGFVHRDLKETNIVFGEDKSISLIDLDGLKYVGDVLPHEAAANLRRLARGLDTAGLLTRQNVIAFMKLYCRGCGVWPRELFPRPDRKKSVAK